MDVITQTKNYWLEIETRKWQGIVDFHKKLFQKIKTKVSKLIKQIRISDMLFKKRRFVEFCEKSNHLFVMFLKIVSFSPNNNKFRENQIT